MLLPVRSMVLAVECKRRQRKGVLDDRASFQAAAGGSKRSRFGLGNCGQDTDVHLETCRDGREREVRKVVIKGAYEGNESG